MSGLKKNKRHGMCRTPTYRSWDAMKDRCRNPKNPQYKDYGGRGIAFCKRWNDFRLFLKDMGIRPKGTTINRINNNLGYSKKNCEWANWSEQGKNKRLRNFGASKVQGVHFDGRRKRWLVEVFNNKKRMILGRFKTEIEAIERVRKYRSSICR